MVIQRLMGHSSLRSTFRYLYLAQAHLDGALSRVFRAKYLEALLQAHLDGELRFSGATSDLSNIAMFQDFIAGLKAKDWVVYAKPPFGGFSCIHCHTDLCVFDTMACSATAAGTASWPDAEHYSINRNRRLPQPILSRT